VAMEEASRMGAGCLFIDQDIDVTKQRLINLFISSDSLWQSYERFLEAYNEMKEADFSRSYIQERDSLEKDLSPETFRVITEDRDKHMFTELRRLEGKIVAVVGMGHMDGIESLWKRAENGDDWHPPANQKCWLAL
ncbi:hypothetical protein MKW94_030691, partial [Papaver nudicaule]|nr:hypothetical protein [Papaver nudicaule]